MRIVITDTGDIWNQDNPYLEKLKDIILVICLKGRRVTDQYECFVSPYQQAGMGISQYGEEDVTMQTLASVGEELIRVLGNNDDIVFLADQELSTLYPYYIIKKVNEFNRLHLVTMSPWRYEDSYQMDMYHQLISDFSNLTSILYIDSKTVLSKTSHNKTMPEVMRNVRDYLDELMPIFLNGIYEMKERPCFFDFSSMSYVPAEEGFDRINGTSKKKIEKEITFPIERKIQLLGMVIPPFYPDDSHDVKKVLRDLK